MIRKVLCAALASTACAALALPSFNEVKASYRSSDSVLLDRHGEPVYTLRTDHSVRRLDWVPLKQISPALRQALLLSEDKRFYEHAGVDWQGVGAAAWANLWSSKTRGASTVTMQLAGLLDDELAAPKDRSHGGRSWSGKLGQAATALRLERTWRKDQILEAYLNLVSLRGELAGISALSAAMFQKYPSGLDAREAAITAALVRAPNAKPEAVARRACAILEQHAGQTRPTAQEGIAAQASAKSPPCYGLTEYTQALLAHPSADRLDRDAQLAPHLARRLFAAQPGPAPQTLRSTLDARLQRFTRDTLRRHLAELQGRHVEDGAVIVIDNASGDVLAWVGSSGELSQAADVDGVMSPRQAGSTLKPFLYELAIEKHWLTAASVLNDSPVGLPTAAGLYVPENYDHRFKGQVSVRTALASSLNVPAVRTAVLVTPELLHQRLQAVGLKLPQPSGFYGYSLALGSPEVTLASLANAYRALANGGQASPLRMRADAAASSGTASSKAPNTVAATPVMDAAASFIVADILADREARVPTFGLDNALAARYWAAVKTGTSKDMRDNWCVGFSRRYTVGVWVGNASGEPMWDVSGVTGAAPVWRAVMDELRRVDSGRAESNQSDFARAIAGTRSQANALAPGAGWRAPAAPGGLVHQMIRYESVLEPERHEWFLSGTEQPGMPDRIALVSRAQGEQVEGGSGHLITAPLDHTLLALDPDIPPQAQRVKFAALEGLPANWAWRLDGKRLGTARPLMWPMWPGPHRLELLDAAGRARDTAVFEVRGADIKMPKTGANPPTRYLSR